MSFNKVVNGVTFTSDNYTNIDVRFERTRIITYLYISTTDNHAFNSNAIFNYYIVHGYSGLSITKIELQNDNRTAKLSVWTSEFDESDSYNIRQLPLIELVESGPTQKLDDHSENGYKVYIPNDCTSVNGVRARHSYSGYAVVPPLGVNLNNDIVKTIYADINGDNNNRVQGTLDGTTIKFIFTDAQWRPLNYSRVRDNKGNLIYNLQDYVKKLTPVKPKTIMGAYTAQSYENGTVSEKYNKDKSSLLTTGDTITYTVTPNKGYGVDFVKVYRFKGDPDTLDWSKGTVVKDFQSLDNLTYTITNDDIGNSLGVNVQFSLLKFKGKIENNIDNTSYTHDDKTITLTANDGYKITSASIDYEPYVGAGYTNVANFTINGDGKTATATIPNDYLNDSSIKLELDGKTESTKPYTLADVGLKCNNENATLKVVDNTATLTAASGYKITSATITSKNSFDFSGSTRQNHDFTISEDGSSATITLVPLKTLDYFLKVSTEEKPSEPQPQPQPKPSEPDKPQPSEPQPSQPETKKFSGEIVLNNDVKDKIKFEFDKQITVKISVVDSKYNINSLYYIYQPYPGSGLEKSSNGFTINADKKTATLVIPDGLLDVWRIRIGGDIADTTPLEPETTTAKTQRVYMVDDKGLNELTKQAENYYKDGVNANYDFTEFINQLYYLPFTVDENLSTPTNKIATGLWELNAPAREMKDNILNIDLGEIKVVPENDNGFDYNIESIKLYLPLVLPIQLDFQDCYKKTVSINYQINLLTGSATINVLSNNKLISTFNQNVQTNLQMFSIYNNKDFGSLNNSINNELLTPYIKINYYKPVDNLVSYETLEHNNLSSYTNFVKTRNASVSCGTQQEQQEIENLLNGGIYIKWI